MAYEINQKVLITKTKIQTKLPYIEDNGSFEIDISETAQTTLI